jgi:hypothetical protein
MRTSCACSRLFWANANRSTSVPSFHEGGCQNPGSVPLMNVHLSHQRLGSDPQLSLSRSPTSGSPRRSPAATLPRPGTTEPAKCPRYYSATSVSCEVGCGPSDHRPHRGVATSDEGPRPKAHRGILSSPPIRKWGTPNVHSPGVGRFNSSKHVSTPVRPAGPRRVCWESGRK